MRLVTFSPANERDFLIYLTLAHRWTQDRPWAFSASGGYWFLCFYLDKARRHDQKNVGVFVGGEMVSLVTVEKEADGVYLMHATSPKRSHFSTIACAVYAVGWQLFDQLGAQRVYATSANRATAHLCEACGLKRTSYEEVDQWGNVWREYAMTREEWMENHVQKESSNNQRIRLQRSVQFARH